ncbi:MULTISPECIES: hypothetical protein [unclassified Paenibacillus]|uniref:hypothetical protein n=1 Tax=unclassified Paenibacillus TaxID=185978 RepID=UPI0011158582|nr:MULTISPECIES: hypothetical protein [unclassified Paenibacillus]QID16044.1 hypothetical protein CIC07_25260 [Paenibacillus sp. RUD330]
MNDQRISRNEHALAVQVDADMALRMAGSGDDAKPPKRSSRSPPLEDEGCVCRIGMMTRKAGYLPPAAQRFVEFAAEAFGKS